MEINIILEQNKWSRQKKKNQWNYPTWADLQGKCNESNGEN